MESTSGDPRLTKDKRAVKREQRRLRAQQEAIELEKSKRRASYKRAGAVSTAAIASILAVLGALGLNKSNDVSATPRPTPNPNSLLSDKKLFENEFKRLGAEFSEAEVQRWQRIKDTIAAHGPPLNEEQKNQIAIEKLSLTLIALRDSENPYINQAGAYIDKVGQELNITIRTPEEMKGFAATTRTMIEAGRIEWEISVDRDQILNLQPEVLALLFTHEAEHLRTEYGFRASNMNLSPEEYIELARSRRTDQQFILEEESRAYKTGANALIFQQGLSGFGVNYDFLEQDAIQLLRCAPDPEDVCWNGRISNDPLRFVKNSQ